MKKFRYLIFLLVPLVALDFCTPSTAAKDKKDVANIKTPGSLPGSKNVAVLELFTSQGCSSCPPADRLLGTYASKENVIVLSFHVDYWDRLGWKDPFSSKEYTKRQYNYASALHADVYTPQLVVNGQTEMIGSDANKISNAINKIVEQQPEATLMVKEVKVENGKALVNFDASGKIKNATLNVALVEKKTTTDIKAGENGGVTLTNYNVVINFQTINKVDNGNNMATIDMPSSPDLQNMSVVLFLQDKKSNKISAATQAAF
ncbi:DUF1223 domain-containing protein [Ginsengibacter hankyongi]|nr:DUF1223 domain-containing protein [Ginsengibacter hankyongi]